MLNKYENLSCGSDYLVFNKVFSEIVMRASYSPQT